MKKLLLPILLLLVGTGAGVGAGIMLKEDAPEDADLAAGLDDPCGTADVAHMSADLHEDDDAEPIVAENTEYAKLANQFVVPVVSDDRIAAMMVLSLSVAVPTGQTDAVFAAEPRLRDEFLQVMFGHANIGGFSGNFTSNDNMRTLRTDLRNRARKVLGQTALDVLIIDIVRQDV